MGKRVLWVMTLLVLFHRITMGFRGALSTRWTRTNAICTLSRATLRRRLPFVAIHVQPRDVSAYETRGTRGLAARFQLLASASSSSSAIDEAEPITSAFLLDNVVEESAEWTNYTAILSDVVQRKPLCGKNLLDEDRDMVRDYLFSSQPLLSKPPAPIPSTPSFHTNELTRNRTLLQATLYQQRADFISATNWTKEAYEYCGRCLSYVGDMCARHTAPASIPWYKLRELGISPRENVLATYIYALSRSTHDVGSCLEALAWHNSMFAINEKTVVLRIQAMVHSGQVRAAEQLLRSLSDNTTDETCRRLRTFMPIVSYYCRTNNVDAVWRLYQDMQVAKGVYLEAETYCSLLSAGTEHGWFRQRPALFTQWISDLAEQHLEIDEHCVGILMEGFRRGGHSNVTNEKFIGRVSINNDSTCPVTKSKLQLFGLSDEKRKEAQKQLLDMAASQREEFTLKTTAKFNRTVDDELTGAQAKKELKRFVDWLRWRRGDPITAFVDGANVAYFGQGYVNWTQVLQVVEELERIGEVPLAIMSHKYVSASFRVSGTAKQHVQILDENDLKIINDLNSTGRLFTVPPGCFDDYYWMISSVAQQNTTHRPHILPDNDQGKFPGVRPLVITNDLMRDHRWSLLEPRLFRRWTTCHIVNYSIKSGEVCLFPAKVFSREIQCNPAPTMNNTVAWHFPVKEWDDPDRFCVAGMSGSGELS